MAPPSSPPTLFPSHAHNTTDSSILILPPVLTTTAQAHQLTAPPSGSTSYPSLKHTYSIRYLPTHFYSLIQRPDASLILGTSRGWPSMPQHIKEQIFGSTDDSGWSTEVAENAFEVLSEVLEGSGYEYSPGPEGSVAGVDGGSGEMGKGGFEYGWGGIIGMTPDSVPFIGAIPGKKGQFIGAGFNGHGMARIFMCAPALAEIVLGSKTFEETPMPHAFAITEERLEKLRGVLEAGVVKKSEGLALN